MLVTQSVRGSATPESAGRRSTKGSPSTAAAAATFAVTVSKGSGPRRSEPCVREMLDSERRQGLDTMVPYAAFRDRVFRHREQLLTTLEELQSRGATVLGYGASTKGNVLLQFCGITRAQLPAMSVIGFLDGQSFDLHLMTAFRQALKDVGYIEGRNVAIYFRSADGQTDRLVTLAGDVIGRRVAVIVTTGGGAAALAAYAATTTIPIVFVNGVDPISSGLVMSLNRPGGNATGVYVFQQVLEGKRLGLLRGLVPSAASIAVLLNPTNANFQTQLRGVQDAARDLGQQPGCVAEVDRQAAPAGRQGLRRGACRA